MSNSNVKNGFKSAVNGYNAPFINDEAVPSKLNFSIAPGAANICEVTISATDGESNILNPVMFDLILSDVDSGEGLTAVTASGTVQPKAASGVLISELVAKKAFTFQALATGDFVLEITDTAKTGFYVGVLNRYTGLMDVSRQLITVDYGV